MKKVLIGVQARSNSTRLRGKSSMVIGDKSIVGRVMTQAVRAAGWLQKVADVSVVMLVPEGDRLKNEFGHRYEIFEGPEQDVLQRYYNALNKYDPDYVVRLTGDCAWMTSRMISKVLRDCLKYEADYCSNVLVRTFMEGLDVEVLSSNLLKKLHKDVPVETEDREHVTSALHKILKNSPFEYQNFKIHTVLNEYDMSHLKTSIDTAKEYEESVDKFQQFQDKKVHALSFGGVSN